MFRKILATFFALVLAVSLLPVTPANTTSLASEFTLKAMPGNGVVMLSWTEVTGASEGYYIYRKVAETSNWEGPLTDFGILGTTFFDTEVKNGNLYCYYVAALDSSATEIDRSNEVYAGPAESMPKIIEDCKMVLIFTLDSYEYLANGVKKMMNTPFILVGKRSYLAFRYVTEEVGGSIAWDGAQKKVTVKYKQVTIEMWVGKSTALVNGVPTPIDPNDPKTTPFIKDGRTFVPLRFPVESFKEGDVKWFASTKQAVLSFPGRCEEVREGILARYSKESSVGLLLGYDSNVYPIAILPEANYSPRVGDCLRVTGRNDNPNYPGYLAVFKVEMLDCKSPWPGAWRARVKSIDKTRLSMVVAKLDSESQEMLVKFQQHQSEMMQNLAVGECVLVVGLYVSPVNDAPYVKAYYADEIPCEESKPGLCSGKWFSGALGVVDCINGVAEVYVDGELVRVILPDDVDCLRLKPGYCVRFCGEKSGDDFKASIFKAFPCETPVCDGEIYRGRLLNIDCVSMKIIVSQGAAFNEFDISGMDCESIKALDPSCIQVCALDNGNGVLVALSVTQGNPEDCSRYCQGRVLQVTISRVDCEKGLIYGVLIGNGKEIEMAFDEPSLCKLAVGKCYEICLKPNTDKPFAVSAAIIDCPETCDGEVFVGTVKSSDCNALLAVILTKDGKEVQFKLSGTDCKKLSVGQCVKICAVRDLTGAWKAVGIRFLETGECKPTQQPCRDSSAIVHVLKVNCDALTIRVKVIEAEFGVGMEIDVPIDKNICRQLSPGMCIRACFRAKSMFDFELIGWEEIPPEKCGISTKCDRDIIGRMVSCSEGSIVIEHFGKLFKYAIDTALCEKFLDGDCVKICFVQDKTTGEIKVTKIEKVESKLCENQKCSSVKGVVQRITGDVVYLTNGKKAIYLDKTLVAGIAVGDCVELCVANDRLVWAEKLDPGECELKCDKTVGIKIEVVNCNGSYLEGFLIEGDGFGAGVKIFFDISQKDVFCKLEIGKCYELCVSTGDNGAMTALTAKPIDCPVKICNGRTVKGQIVRVFCEEYIISAEFDGQVRMLSVKPDVCLKAVPGACVMMCIEKDAFGNQILSDIEILDEKECDVSLCNGKTVIGVVTEATEDKEGLLISLKGHDAQFRIGRSKQTGMILFIVKPGDCIEACYTYDFRQDLPIILSLEVLPPGECEKVCEERLWQGTISELLCDRSIAVIIRNGVRYNVQVSETICARLEEGMCVMVCGNWIPETNVFMSNWVRILPYERCQAEGPVIIAKVLRKNCDDEIIRLEYDGHEADFELSRVLCEDLVVGSCYEFVLKTKHDTVKNSINNVRRLISPEGCQTECAGRTILAVVANDACKEGKLKVWINASIATIRYENLASICQELTIGSCIKLCGMFESSPGTVTTAPQIVFKADKIEIVPPEQCTPVCSGDIWKIRILDVKLDDRMAIGEKDGKPVMVSSRLEQIRKLEAGKCYYVCGVWAETRGAFVLFWSKEIPPEQCELKCEGDTVMATIADFNCEKGFVWLVLDGNLKQWAIPPDLCNRLREGVLSNIRLPACAQVCIEDGKIVDLVVMPMSMCQAICLGPETFATVKKIDHPTNTFEVLTKDGSELKLRSVPGVLSKLSIDACIKVCLPEQRGPGNFFDVFIVVVLPPERCQPEICKGETEEMTVVRVDCENGFVGLKNKTGLTLQMKIDVNLCKTLKVGYCYSVCHYKNSAGQEFVQFVKLVSDKPCEAAPCDGNIFVLTVARTDCANGYFIGLDKKRQEYKVFVDASICSQLKIGYCYEVCATSGDGLQMKASSVKLVKEGECPDTCKKIRAYVFYSSCTENSVIIKCTDQEGMNWTLNLSKTKYDCNKVLASSCIEFCVEVKDGKMTNLIVSEVKFLSDTDCGNISSPCKDAMVWNATFTSIDCTNLKGIVKHGDDLVPVSISSNICRLMRLNTCYTLCLKYVNRVLTVVSFSFANSEECLYVQCFVLKVTKPCTDGVLTGTTAQGITYTVKLPKNISCTSIVMGQCYKVCGRATGYTLYAESLESVRCYDDQTTVFEGTIYQMDCQTNSFYIRTENGAEYRVLIPKGYLCSSFEVRMCVVVEGWIDRESPKLIEAKTIKIVNCSQPTQTWEGVVRSTNCEGNIAYVAIGGTTYTVNLPRGYPCEKLQSGMCLKIIGSLHPQSKIAIIATSVEIVDCPEEVQTWTMFLTRYDCRTRYYIAMDGNMPRSVKLPEKFDCYSIAPGSCIKVTGTIKTSVGTVTVSYIQATKIEVVSCPSPLTMKVKIVSLNCTLYKDVPNIVVESAGVQFTCYVTMNFDCSQYEVGDCANITGYVNKEMRYVHLTRIQKIACENEFLVKIAGVHCSSRGNHVSVYVGNVLYSFYLPKGFDCNDLVVGDCYYVTGTKDDTKKTISATSMRKTRC